MGWTALVVLSCGCSSTRGPGFQWSSYPGIIHVACLGDSITYGDGIENRETNHYPAVLGRLLGPKFETRNFGVNGATLLKKGDKPYWNQPEFNAIEAFAPELVIIKLGTNDSKPENWRYKAEFEADCTAFIHHFLRLRSQPRIWLCLPAPVYETRWGINDDTLANEVIPAIKHVAQAMHLPVIDLYDALSNRPDLFPDNIHPNAEGAALMAKTVQAALMAK